MEEHNAYDYRERRAEEALREAQRAAKLAAAAYGVLMEAERQRRRDEGITALRELEQLRDLFASDNPVTLTPAGFEQLILDALTRCRQSGEYAFESVVKSAPCYLDLKVKP